MADYVRLPRPTDGAPGAGGGREGANADYAPAGDYFWPGAFAMYWWSDPKEEMLVVSMMQSPLGRNYQQLVRALVLQAIAE